tara:strand:+ start:650 stop:862 length:213 start_codon:yes stop_codon:yes gene_type:complete
MNKIKEIIWESGYRKNYIAEQIGVHPSHISMWIAENRLPSKPNLRKLAKFLNCKIKDLYPEGIKYGRRQL